MQFQGNAAPLTESALAAAAERLGASRESIWAVLSVETSGAGFLPDRRPKILFERHVFHQRTGGAFDGKAPDLSASAAGGYGASGAFQYNRLARAIALAPGPALDSASWGLGQIMGFNAATVGFTDAAAMVEAFKRGENAQLGAMMAFVAGAGLAPALRARKWADFAHGYNGPAFQKNGYDQKLAYFEAKYRVGPMPSLLVRWLQMGLTFLGVPAVGGVDGWFGQNTQQALVHFQHTAGVPASGEPDAATLNHIAQALDWPLP